METQPTATETDVPHNSEHSFEFKKNKNSSDDDSSDGSFSLGGSFGYDLGEEIIPLKKEDGASNSERRTMPAKSASLRSLTEQLSKEGTVPLSPPPKKKTLGRGMLSSPYNSPGSLGGRRTVGRNSSGPLLGGSSHGLPRSPGALLGGSSHGKPRASAGVLGGSLHGRSRTSSRSSSPGPLGGRIRPRSKSPGQLSGSNHGRIRSTSPGPLLGGSARARSRSPGALLGTRNRSFRAPRRSSLKMVKGQLELVSILRRGKFSQVAPPPEERVRERSVSPDPSVDDSTTGSISISRRVSLRRRRVQFILNDDTDIASYATEESMQFGDLGFEDSGEFEGEHGGGIGVEYGQRSMRGDLPFVEVMDLDGYGSLSLNDTSEHDYVLNRFNGYGELNLNDTSDHGLMNRFNGSTIHEELGASSAAFSFGSALSDEELKSIEEFGSESGSPLPTKKDIIPIADLNEPSCRPKDLSSISRPRHPSPPPAQSSFSSLLSEDSANEEKTEGETPRIDNRRKGSSESSLDLSSMKLTEKSESETKPGKDVSSATSSESPTGVAELEQDDTMNDEAETDDDDHQQESLENPAIVSKLVPPIG